MRILHVNTRGLRGEAGRAAYRLALGLRRLGHEARMIRETAVRVGYTV